MSKIRFNFANQAKNGYFPVVNNSLIKMKDRIRQIMESQHMTQQTFAEFICIAPATLSGIFNDRQKPTINIVEAIKKKLTAISTDWLMFGSGQMYLDSPTPSSAVDGENQKRITGALQDTLFDFDQNGSNVPQTASQTPAYPSMGHPVRPEVQVEVMKNYDKQPRRVTEIRVFYDDQTWESFVPAKK
jgi:transcriptional regulator with XRE-family HTH domain